MKSLTRTLIDICLLRESPLATSSSRVVSMGLVGLHWSLGSVLSAFRLPPEQSIASSLLGTLLVVALTQSFLLFRGLGERFFPTLNAMVGTDLIFGLVAVPLSAWFYNAPDSGISQLLSLVLIAWSIAVTAHIMRHSLSVTPSIGFLAAMSYTFVSFFIASLITE